MIKFALLIVALVIAVVTAVDYWLTVWANKSERREIEGRYWPTKRDRD